MCVCCVRSSVCSSVYDADSLALSLSKPNFSKANWIGNKGMLLAGPPGIGKTSAAMLMGEQLGFEVMEMNASDVRSKKMVEKMLR